jgi:hypothetical protein
MSRHRNKMMSKSNVPRYSSAISQREMYCTVDGWPLMFSMFYGHISDLHELALLLALLAQAYASGERVSV